MTRKLEYFFSKLANLWIVVVSGMAVFLLMSILSKIDREATGGGANGILGLQFAFTPEAAGTIIRLWGAEGASRIRDTLWIDYIYPPFYAAFLASTVAYFSTIWKMFTQFARYTLILLPFLAAILDYVENTLQLIILAQFPKVSGILILAASIAATVKWLIIGWSILVILYLIIYQLVKAGLSGFKTTS